VPGLPVRSIAQLAGGRRCCCFVRRDSFEMRTECDSNISTTTSSGFRFSPRTTTGGVLIAGSSPRDDHNCRAHDHRLPCSTDHFRTILRTSSASTPSPQPPDPSTRVGRRQPRTHDEPHRGASRCGGRIMSRRGAYSRPDDRRVHPRGAACCLPRGRSRGPPGTPTLISRSTPTYHRLRADAIAPLYTGQRWRLTLHGPAGQLLRTWRPSKEAPVTHRRSAERLRRGWSNHPRTGAESGSGMLVAAIAGIPEPAEPPAVVAWKCFGASTTAVLQAQSGGQSRFLLALRQARGRPTGPRPRLFTRHHRAGPAGVHKPTNGWIVPSNWARGEMRALITRCHSRLYGQNTRCNCLGTYRLAFALAAYGAWSGLHPRWWNLRDVCGTSIRVWLLAAGHWPRLGTVSLICVVVPFTYLTANMAAFDGRKPASHPRSGFAV